MKHNMKEDLLHKGIQGIKKDIRLSPADKGAVLSRLMEHVALHPGAVKPRKSFIQKLFPSPYAQVFSFRFEYTIATMLIVLLAGGSVASAAVATLPGDILYPIKISVLEPIQGAFITGDVPKAHWAEEKTIRRLEEAETLAAQGRLSLVSVQTIKDNFEKSANEFNSIMQSSEAIASSTQLVDTRIDFEAKMSAHSQILSSVASSSSSTEQDVIAPLTGSVEENARRAKEGRVQAAQDFLKRTQGNTSERAKASGEQRSQRTIEGDDARKSFDNRVQSVQTIITDTRQRLNETATSTTVASSTVQSDILQNVPQTLRAAEDSLKEAQQKHNSGDSNNAFSSLLDSESAAKQADTSVTQGIRLGQEQRDSQQTRLSTSGSGTRSGDGDSQKQSDSGQRGSDKSD